VLSYAVTASLSALGALAAALFLGHWTSSLRSLGSNGGWLAAFIVATVAWTVFSLQDSVMTGMRQAHWVPIENSLFSFAKVLLLVAIASPAPDAGVFLAWNVPVLISLVPINLLIFRRLIPRHVQGRSAGLPDLRRMLAFASGNYVASLFFLASTTLLPLVVAAEAGAAATAYFYVPWTIATGLQLVALNMTTSFTVEVALDESRLREYCRRVLAQTLRLVVPMTVVAVASATYVLRIFGGAYPQEGAMVLRLLCLATIPNVIIAVGLSVARLQHKGRVVLVIQGTLCILTLGLSVFLLPRLGINGVGVACLASQLAVALWLLFGILRPILLLRPPLAAQTGRERAIERSS
jgi:O-antigen/teichoic acid export membrane protein